MAASGNRVAVLKLAGILVLVVLVLWWIKGFFF
jgi:blocked-early-in-transport protein 1